ncbi:MAG: outer membrane protein assembly factor BamD [Burkholderiales bacterium]|nr:outer membrane protein assembly factor BamD [Burkholderiales bacterium]
MALALALTAAACGTTDSEPYDDTRGWSAERIYNEAKSELLAGSYKKAAELYQKLEARYPYGKYAQQAQVELAYTYYKDNETVLALAEVERFIKLYPDHSNLDYALYLKGLINFNEDLGIFGGLANQDMSERDPKAAVESFEAFRELVERYPESRYAPDAFQRMRYLVNALAINEVRVAHYYLRRKAYVAAVNRAQSVLLNYQQTTAVEPALVILVKAYDGLGLADLRDDAQRLLALNYPDSTKQVAARDRRWWQVW